MGGTERLLREDLAGLRNFESVSALWSSARTRKSELKVCIELAPEILSGTGATSEGMRTLLSGFSMEPEASLHENRLRKSLLETIPRREGIK